MCRPNLSSPCVRCDLAACRALLLQRARALVGAVNAEDLVQDAMERALRKAGQFEPGTNLAAWVTRIMTNLAADQWRKGRKWAPARISPDGLAAPTSDDEPEWEGLSREDVREAVRKLSPRVRQVFELHHDWQLGYADVARQLGVPLGTVCTRLHRARRKLRELLSLALTEPGSEGATQPRGAGTIRHLTAKRRQGSTSAVAASASELAKVA